MKGAAALAAGEGKGVGAVAGEGPGAGGAERGDGPRRWWQPGSRPLRLTRARCMRLAPRDRLKPARRLRCGSAAGVLLWLGVRLPGPCRAPVLFLREAS